jgi:hypothetical protein
LSPFFRKGVVCFQLWLLSTVEISAFGRPACGARPRNNWMAVAVATGTGHRTGRHLERRSRRRILAART